MASSENLFAFEQIRVDNRVDATLIFEGVNKVLEEYLREKVSTQIQETMFLTS